MPIFDLDSDADFGLLDVYGPRERLHYSEGTDECAVETYQYDEPILRDNYEARKDPQSGWDAKREFRRVAHIPLVKVTDLMNRGFNIFDPNNRRRFRRMLNESEFKPYRLQDNWWL